MNIPSELMWLKIQCKHCNRPFMFLCPKKGLEEWRNGKLIQDALPMLSIDEREMLISDICSDCFDRICPEPEE